MGGQLSGSREHHAQRSVEAVRASNRQIAIVLKHMSISKQRIEDRVSMLQGKLAEICSREAVGGLSEKRRRQTLKSLLQAERRVAQLDREIAQVEQQRDSNEDIGTLLQVQSATASALKELQNHSPELFAADSTAPIREMAGLAEKLQQYKSAMEVKSELAAMDMDDEDIDVQVEAFERKFQAQRLLDMDQPVPEATVRVAGLRATVAQPATPVQSSAAAAAAAAAAAHRKDAAEDGCDDADRKHI